SGSNVIVGNQVSGNGGTTYPPIGLTGTTSVVARNFAGAGVDVADSGGFRQTIDGWIKDGGLTSLTNSEMARNNFTTGNAGAGRFRAVRSGSVTGLVITSDVPSATTVTGTLTAEVFINLSGITGGSGTGTGLTAALDSTEKNIKATTQAMNADPFQAGHEIYVALTTAAWSATGAKIRCAIEIED
ncbi:MAG: hypothetical protein KF688_17365, partial [Pirellulales bacterium]|nr:hypothetical protein [Pirellulales bacterium]